MIQLAEKYIGKPARVCPGCGSNRVWLPVTGGLRCLGCKPPEGEPEATLIAVEVEGGFEWSKPSDFDTACETEVEPVRRPHQATKPVARNRDIFVSTKLDWFSLAISTLTDFADEETEQVYRKLDERYFAWLHSRVLVLGSSQQAEAISLLWGIAIEGLNAGMLPPAMLSRGNWPIVVPEWYEGPVSPSDHAKRIGIPG